MGFPSTVRPMAERPWRRFVRPSVAIRGDYVLPDAAPLPLALDGSAREVLAEVGNILLNGDSDAHRDTGCGRRIEDK